MRVLWLTAFAFVFSCGTQLEGYGSDRHSAQAADDDDDDDARALDAGSDRAPADSGARLDSGARDAANAPRSGSARPDAGYATSADTSLGCVDEARWIYAIATTGQLLRYEPDANSLTEVGTLDCPTALSPFSMAVNRSAIAYVLHADQKIYRVDTSDASCQTTSYKPGVQGFETFGMGFVSSTPGSDDETLFIAGGRADGLTPAKLGALDTSSWGATVFGELDGQAELTGNADAELWAFIADATPMVVRQLDKNTGATMREFDVSSIDHSSASAWAFAYWGGRYYIFFQGTADASTSIYRLTPELNVVEAVHEDTGYRIVGAGVSTCAPTVLL